jgi:hypothetical protein
MARSRSIATEVRRGRPTKPWVVVLIANLSPKQITDVCYLVIRVGVSGSIGSRGAWLTIGRDRVNEKRERFVCCRGFSDRVFSRWRGRAHGGPRVQMIEGMKAYRSAASRLGSRPAPIAARF